MGRPGFALVVRCAPLQTTCPAPALPATSRHVTAPAPDWGILHKHISQHDAAVGEGCCQCQQRLPVASDKCGVLLARLHGVDCRQAGASARQGAETQSHAAQRSAVSRVSTGAQKVLEAIGSSAEVPGYHTLQLALQATFAPSTLLCCPSSALPIPLLALSPSPRT